jgi:hypothetical protein
MNGNQHHTTIIAMLLAGAAIYHAHGAAFVRNPSFESNFNET